MAKTYAQMDLKELEGELQKITAERKELKGKALKIHAIYDKKKALAEAQRKAAQMTDDEKRALLQTIEAEGIASEEAVEGLTASH